MHIYRTMVPGNGVLHQILTRGGETALPLVDAAHNRHLFTYGGASSMSPPEQSCSNPTRPIRWPSFWLTDRVADRLSRWNDGSTN